MPTMWINNKHVSLYFLWFVRALTNEYIEEALETNTHFPSLSPFAVNIQLMVRGLVPLRFVTHSHFSANINNSNRSKHTHVPTHTHTSLAPFG